MDDNRHACVFQGQLKQGVAAGDAAPYCIQTILPYELWHPMYLYYFASRRAESDAALKKLGRTKTVTCLNHKWPQS